MQKEISGVIGAILLCSVLAPASFADQRVVKMSASAGGRSGVPGSYMESSHSASAWNMNPKAQGLPMVVHSQAVGQPGDPVSRGNFSGNGAMAQVTSKNGLPLVRNSKFMTTPGDSQRSDLNRNIDGSIKRASTQVRHFSRQPVQQSTVQQRYQPALGYGDYTK